MSTISQRDRLILQTVMLQAEVPIPRVARQLGFRSETVRRTVQRLQEIGVLLGKQAYLNLSALGLVEYLVFLSLEGFSEANRQLFVQALCDYEQIGFVAEVGGDFQYELHFYGRDSQDFIDFIDALTARFRWRIQAQAITLVHEEEYSGPRYVNTGAPPQKTLGYAPVPERVLIDQLDHRILQILANSENNTKREIGRKLNIPHSTVSDRIQRLEQTGVITGHYYLCDIKPMGDLPFSLLIQANVLSRAKRTQLLKFCRLHNRIAYINILIGTWQARIFARVQHYAQTMDIMHELYAAFPNDIQAIRIMPQLKMYKCSFYPFKKLEHALPKVNR